MKHSRYPKRDAIKNYFPLPNETFALGLRTGEIAVYAYLLYCENRKTFQCHPGYKTIGGATDMSQNTVHKYVTALEEKQLIKTEPTTIRTKDGRVRNGSLLYTIRPIQEAVRYFHERQLTQLDIETAKRRVAKKLERYKIGRALAISRRATPSSGVWKSPAGEAARPPGQGKNARVG